MRANRIVEPLPGAVLAAVVAVLALGAATRWPMVAAVVAGLLFGGLFWTLSWIIGGGRTALSARVAVGALLGVLAGELAAVVLFSGPVDRVIAEQATVSPAVVQATAAVDQARAQRAGLDDAVAQAGRRRDEALVVARCEFNPSQQCPQIRITGVPGAGPETRTANEFLADAQHEYDTAVADRDSRAGALDSTVADRERALAGARDGASAAGPGARWSAMNGYTLAHPGALVLRVLVDVLFVVLSLLPLILRMWRGKTSAERGEEAVAEQEQAALDADTAIAVKRAEVRATIEEMWAEQQVESARLAIAAQNEIDREQQRRRVAHALAAPEPVRAVRPQPVDDVYLPIAAEAESVSMQALPAPESQNLPAPVEPQRGGIPVIPDVTKAAVRWIRPFVPPIVAGAIDNATKPLRHVFEETEEIHFTLRRTHKVTVEADVPAEAQAPAEPGWMDVPGIGRIQAQRGPGWAEADSYPELPGRRQLPPGQ